MKLLYQQLLSFFVVIFATLLIISTSVINFSRRQAYDTTWTQLEGYAQNLGKEFTAKDPVTGNYAQINPNFLDQLQVVMSKQKLVFAIFNVDGQQIYPQTSQQKVINSYYWQRLKKGKVIRIENNRVQNVLPQIGHDEMTVVLYPWRDQHKKLLGAIWIGARVSSIQYTMQQIQQNLAIALISSLLVASLLSIVLARYQVSRINRLKNATRRIAEGDFDLSLPTRGRDEIDGLAEDFNKMVISLDESDKEIHRQEERRKQFMADAAHEMRTPLTTINGLLEGLAYDAIPEASKADSIRLMQNETRRLIRLVNENLDYEKIRTNQIPLHKKTFSLLTALNQLMEQLKPKAEAAGDQLFVNVKPADSQIYADYDRFIQIMVNIITNAIQFTEQGHIEIEGHSDQTGAYIEIRDDGIGMSDDQVRNIWERYYKADPSRKQTKGESGLGLAIVHSLIERHHGTIKVASTLHKGTTFTIYFPDATHQPATKTITRKSTPPVTD